MCILLVPGLLAFIAFDREATELSSGKWNERIPVEIRDFTRSIYYNCRPTGFFRVNGKQPWFQNISHQIQIQTTTQIFHLRVSCSNYNKCGATVTHKKISRKQDLTTLLKRLNFPPSVSRNVSRNRINV